MPLATYAISYREGRGHILIWLKQRRCRARFRFHVQTAGLPERQVAAQYGQPMWEAGRSVPSCRAKHPLSCWRIPGDAVVFGTAEICIQELLSPVPPVQALRQPGMRNAASSKRHRATTGHGRRITHRSPSAEHSWNLSEPGKRSAAIKHPVPLPTHRAGIMWGGI